MGVNYLIPLQFHHKLLSISFLLSSEDSSDDDSPYTETGGSGVDKKLRRSVSDIPEPLARAL